MSCCVYGGGEEKPQTLHYAALCRKTFPRRVRGTADPSTARPTARRGRRDDKGKSDGSMESGCLTGVFFITLGGRRPMGNSGRNDNVAWKTMFSVPKPNCHLDRSAAEWRDLRFLFSLSRAECSQGLLERGCLHIDSTELMCCQVSAHGFRKIQTAG
jgi:hypothetical protein